ncbi:MAG: hypothetical protein HOY75_43520 [Streptomyces sp.]|nr:hypothetical protein [Streptomyces sp.]
MAGNWPNGVTARYLNRAGATVDVRGVFAASWRCGGCPARSSIATTLSREEACREAQAHANECTAVPRP